MMNALKEWATIVNALENGDQTVLLRKGGILEDSSGFVVESEKFFLFPTFEHQERSISSHSSTNTWKMHWQANQKTGLTTSLLLHMCYTKRTSTLKTR